MTRTERIESITKELETFDQYVQDMNYEEIKDIQVLSETMVKLSGFLARSTSLVADAAELQAEAQKTAYHNYIAMSHEKGLNWAPSVVKDYVSSQFSKELRCATYADRVNRMLTHTLDVLRSILSAAKTELATLHFQP